MSIRFVDADGTPVPLPPGWAPLAAGRTDDVWTWTAVDRATGASTGPLGHVSDADLRIDLEDDLRWSGHLTWSGPADEEPDWRQTQVAARYSATLADGSAVSWPMSVYRCATSRRDHDGDHVSVRVSLYDRSLPLRRGRTRTSYTLARGTTVVPAVRSLLATHAAGAPCVVEDSAATLRSDMTWDGGTPWATVIDDLLGAIGYTRLAADRDGVLRSGPHVAPTDRPVVWTYAPGPSALHSGRWGHEEDDYDVPNRVTLVSRGDGDAEALTSTVTLDDLVPGHPLSQAVTGEWVDLFEEGVEAATQAVLDAEARRRLMAGLRVASTVDVSHAPLPLLPGDRVRWARLDADAVVRRVDIDCSSGAEWETTLQLVLPETTATDAQPAPTPPRTRHRWCTVTQASPLRVRLDGEASPLPVAPWGRTSGLSVGDRLWAQITGRQVVVLGKNDE